MKLTADTITDEQIRELGAKAISFVDRLDCEIAYRGLGEFRRSARARCAEILNVRKERP